MQLIYLWEVKAESFHNIFVADAWTEKARERDVVKRFLRKFSALFQGWLCAKSKNNLSTKGLTEKFYVYRFCLRQQIRFAATFSNGFDAIFVAKEITKNGNNELSINKKNRKSIAKKMIVWKYSLWKILTHILKIILKEKLSILPDGVPTSKILTSKNGKY